jgi:GDPmannose 4,6-dehydratase
MSGKRALITGITGQDGSYLAEFLLEKGYEVHGLIRRSSTLTRGRIDHLNYDPHVSGQKISLYYGDLLDASSLVAVLNRTQPDEIYHLAAQSHVAVSFEMPEFTSEATALGTMRLLEAIRQIGRPVRFYQAGSSEMYGRAIEDPQDEQTPFRPRSPYAISKVFAHQTAVYHREAYGMFCANGILFNHESPRRGETFVTRKTTRAVAQIVAGRKERLYLGNLKPTRDWGYAPEYVEAMWLMLQHDTPDDFVVATGESHSVAEFAAEAFKCVGLNWHEFVSYDPEYERPAEVDCLRGNAAKAERQLGWRPRTRFRDLVRLMVASDLRLEGLDPEKHMQPA